MLKSILMLISVFFASIGFAQANTLELCSQDNAASCPLTLSDPTPPLPITKACNAAPFVEVYTVTSYVSSVVYFDSIDIVKLIGDTAFSTVSVTGGSCVTRGNVAAKGTCTINVTITPKCTLATQENATFPQTINRNLVVNPKGNIADLFKNINLKITQPSNDYITVVSGEQATPASMQMGTADPSVPFLAVHNSAGQWTTQTPNFNSVVSTSVFNSSTCSGNICMAVGQLGEAPNAEPIVFLSKDKGLTWDIVTNFPGINGILYGVSCIPGSNNCSVVGYSNFSPAEDKVVVTKAVEYVTPDGGTTWNGPYTSSALDPTLNSSLFTASCGNHCMATGMGVSSSPSTKDNGPGPEKAFVVNSGGTGLLFFKNVLQFTDSACSGDTCIAVGQYNDFSTTAQPFITKTNDQWANHIDFTGSVANDIILYGASCTTANSKIVCMAVGGAANETGPSTPIVYVNNDTANTNNWQNITPSVSGLFTAVSCVTNNNAALCTLVGVDIFDGTPLLLEWVGGTFTTRSPDVEAFLSSTACTTSTSGAAVCTAAGILIPTTPEGVAPVALSPYLLVNTNVGNGGSWVAPTTSPILPDQGCFSNAGADGASSGVLLAPGKGTACNILSTIK